MGSYREKMALVVVVVVRTIASYCYSLKNRQNFPPYYISQNSETPLRLFALSLLTFSNEAMVVLSFENLRLLQNTARYFLSLEKKKKEQAPYKQLPAKRNATLSL